PYTGWCPRGGWAEDLTTPPGLLANYDQLRETPSAAPEQRSAWNVRDAHASLIVTLDGDVARSPGTSFTRACAQLVFEQPCHVANIASPSAPADAAEWLADLMDGQDDDPFVLNVAGPRESEYPGIYVATLRFLEHALT